MAYNYERPQMQTLASPILSDGNLSPAAATRMRMIALTPRGSLNKAAKRLSLQGYSSTMVSNFEDQALERELTPGFPGFFAHKEHFPAQLASPRGSSARIQTPDSRTVATPRVVVDGFKRRKPVSISQELQHRNAHPSYTEEPEPLSPRRRGCAVAPSLSQLRLDDVHLRCHAPSPGPAWSGSEVKKKFPGPGKVNQLCLRREGCCGHVKMIFLFNHYYAL